MQRIIYPSSCSTEQDLLEFYAAIAMEKQLKLSEVIGNKSWNADITLGEISFGDGLDFPMQLLGSFSHSSGTWLWAWANEASNLPESLIAQSLELKKYGEENKIDLLTVSEFKAEKSDLHLIGMIAAGMFDASGYYMADYGQGILLVTIKSDSIDKSRDDIPQSIPTVISRVISQLNVNHKNVLMNYLSIKGYDIAEEGNKITGKKGGATIPAEFDEMGRLTKISVE